MPVCCGKVARVVQQPCEYSCGLVGKYDTSEILTKIESVLSSKSCLFSSHSALRHSATSPSFIEYLLSSQTFQPVPSHLINLLMLPPSFPIGSLLFLCLEMTIPQGGEAAVFFSLCLDTARGGELALLKHAV